MWALPTVPLSPMNSYRPQGEENRVRVGVGLALCVCKDAQEAVGPLEWRHQEGHLVGPSQDSDRAGAGSSSFPLTPDLLCCGEYAI